jgi:hypothetical protein
MSVNWTLDTPFLVLIHQYDGDISWSSRLKYPYVIYYKDRSDKAPFTAPNKAKAETNILKFIVDFYDQLPKNLISVYQYEYKMSHSGSLVDILNDPNFENQYYNSQTPGFLNFNHVIMGKLYQYKPAMIESGWWKNTMQPFFGDIESYYDFTNGKKGCAQYVVSRDRILSLPKEFYQNMFQWLVDNTLDQEVPPFDPGHKSRISMPIDKHILSNWYTSRYMEWSWQLIYTCYKKSEDGSYFLCKPEASKNDSNDIEDNKPRNISILALYGAGSYQVNVTMKVLKSFLYSDTQQAKLCIPKETSFNNLFSDLIYGQAKTLTITINHQEYILNEIRDQCIILDIY